MTAPVTTTRTDDPVEPGSGTQVESASPPAVEPSATPRRLPTLALAGIAAVVLLALAIPAGPGLYDLGSLTRSALLTAVALPLVLRLFRPRGWMVVVACALAFAPVASSTLANMGGHDFIRDRNHDGGVYLTRAAAQDVLHGRDPYATDHSKALPSVWNPLGQVDGHDVVNPLVRYYPYLPGWFLVQTPFLASAHGLGLGWDPRLLDLAALLAAIVLIALRPDPAWVRAGAILALGTVFTTLYSSWGTNDAAVAALVVVGVLAARRWPRAAGLVLALAISGKFLVGVALPPLVIVLVRRDGWAAVRRLWTLPAALVATCLPYLMVHPGAFVQSVVSFNLGITKLRFPTSGIGLPVIDGGTFHGPVLTVATLAGGLVAVLVPGALAWRWPRLESVLLGTAIGVAGILVPARTFQQPYLTLLLILAATGAWLLSSPERGGRAAPAVVAGAR